jgi:hypothetical protein
MSRTIVQEPSCPIDYGIPMRFDTKIAVLIRDDLAAWQKLNVACFLAGGLVGFYPELAGQPYRDGEGREYGPLIRQPVLIFTASEQGMKQALERSLHRNVTPSIYTRELFSTNNDVDNRAAVEAVGTAELDLMGLAVCAGRKDVDKIVKGMSLHS